MENPVPTDAIPRGKWQVSEVPSGSTLGRGMCAEKRTDDRAEWGGTLNSGDPGANPLSGVIRAAAEGLQRNEEALGGDRESDSPIVVRDGRADHTAKGRAEGQRGHSTHARETIIPITSVSRTLSASGVGGPQGSAVPIARLSEEPGAAIPHAGICEGGAGQPASLPQSPN
jgi:hypothetical protein